MAAVQANARMLVGDDFGLEVIDQAVLTVGIHLKVTAANADDIDELASALTARRDALAAEDSRFQVPVIVQVPDPVFLFRTAFHEWSEVSADEMERRGWHDSFVRIARSLGT